MYKLLPQSPFPLPTRSLCTSITLPPAYSGDIECVSYVFNGDWVGRGKHQLAVVCLLFALKTLYPARVFLVRGNHEFRSQSEQMGEYGFKYHMGTRLTNTCMMPVYEAIHIAFEWLPLGAVVAGAVFVVHGGIGDGSWGVRDLAVVQRPIRECDDPGVPACVMQALWSDPSDSDADMARGVVS